MTTTSLQSLTIDHVRSVYSGKLGCACGCRGKHSYNPAHTDEASADRGYPVTSDECSERSVANVLKAVQQANGVEIADDGSHASFETETRLYIVYLRDGVRLPVQKDDAA